MINPFSTSGNECTRLLGLFNNLDFYPTAEEVDDERAGIISAFPSPCLFLLIIVDRWLVSAEVFLLCDECRRISYAFEMDLMAWSMALFEIDRYE